MNPNLSLSMWVSLPTELRYRIRAIFNIPRSGVTEVDDGVIKSDGTTYNDIKALTIEKMQEYLQDDSTDFHKLFDKVVAKVNDEIQGKNKPVSANASDPVTVIIEPKKRGRPAKQNAEANK